MQKVLERTAYAKRYAARRKFELERKIYRRDRAKYKKDIAERYANEDRAGRAARKMSRENWELGPLSPWRATIAEETEHVTRNPTAYPRSPSVAHYDSPMARAMGPRFGSFNMNAVNKIPVPEQMRSSMKHQWVCVGDRICVVNGNERVRGQIGTVKTTLWEAETVNLEYIGSVSLMNTRRTNLLGKLTLQDSISC